MNNKSTVNEHVQYSQSLEQQVTTVENESRMVLPGIQTLFGFQMIAIFNPGFKANLSEMGQIVHLIALFLVAISGVLVVAPAAYHRQANHQISKHFVQLSSNFLAWAMIPLALGTCLDIFLVTKIILQSLLVSAVISILFFAFYPWTWFIFPKIRLKKSGIQLTGDM